MTIIYQDAETKIKQKYYFSSTRKMFNQIINPKGLKKLGGSPQHKYYYF